MTVRHRLEIMITRAQQVHSSACALNNWRPLHVTHFAAVACGESWSFCVLPVPRVFALLNPQYVVAGESSAALTTIPRVDSRSPATVDNTNPLMAQLYSSVIVICFVDDF